MASVDIEQLDLAQLRAHKADVERLIVKREQETREQAKQAALAAVRQFGFDFADLFPGAGSGRPASEGKKERKAVAPVYAHPENPALTWTGRGRPPKWVEEQLAAGKTREDLKIAN